MFCHTQTPMAGIGAFLIQKCGQKLLTRIFTRSQRTPLAVALI
jgi:hypothetical protein